MLGKRDAKASALEACAQTTTRSPRCQVPKGANLSREIAAKWLSLQCMSRFDRYFHAHHRRPKAKLWFFPNRYRDSYSVILTPSLAIPRRWAYVRTWSVTSSFRLIAPDQSVSHDPARHRSRSV